MAKTLTTYLCEKPSQAADVAAFLGLKASLKRRNHYIDPVRGIAVCHAVGHLFELAPPEHYEPKLAKSWNSANLPVIPAKFEVTLKPEMKGVFSVIQGLLNKTDVLVIATDADNEGELIARDIIFHCKYKGQLKRALYSATDDKSLKAAFDNLQPASKTEFMAKEADIRRRLDWLIGMNCTMSFTQRLKSKNELKKGAFSVGRVITALGLIVYRREMEIQNFKPTKFYTVSAICVKGGERFNATLKMPAEYVDDNGRCLKRQTADAFAAAMKGQTFSVTQSEKQIKSVSAELPYDLAALQIDADSFGIDADETLSLLQGLYDKPLSAVTYPRTDCRFLPEGMIGDAKVIMNHLNKLDTFKKFELDFDKKAKCFNDKKVAIHHGIIPSKGGINPKKLTDKQLIIYMLIALRYVQQFMPAYRYESTKVELQRGKFLLTVSAKKVVDLGWKVAELKSEKEKPEANLIALDKGDQAKVIDVLVEDKVTQPPSRLSSGKLIEAMEHPERFETDPDIKKLLKDGDGIGTPATRSDGIKRAFQKGLIIKSGKVAKPSRTFTKYASDFELFNPGFTAILQRTFNAVSSGKLQERELFIQNENIVRQMVEKWAS